MRNVRVAWSIAEQKADRKKLSFTVDDTFGKSLIVAIRSDAPLFDVLRPTTESIKSIRPKTCRPSLATDASKFFQFRIVSSTRENNNKSGNATHLQFRQKKRGR